MLYRNQWATVSIPYQTFAFSGEVALWRSRNMNSGLSAGVSLFNDHAGTLHYGTTSGHLSLAYYRAVNRAATSYLSFGVEGGYAQSGYDPSQAAPQDPSETFGTQQVGYPLLAAGVAWYWQPTGDFHTKVGFSVRNINRPNISYMQLDRVFLHREDMRELFGIRTARTPDGWEVFYRIPLSFLRLFWPGFAFAGALRANVYKCGDLTAREHYLSWNQVNSRTPDFHRPQDFGRMVFG